MLNYIQSFTHSNHWLVLGSLLLLSVGCSKEDVQNIPIVPPSVNVTKTLKEQALFPIGAAVTVAHLKESDFSNTFKNNYNQLSAEYEMKMSNIWTSANSYSFSNTDYLVDYAGQNNLKVHGHVLLWHQTFPEWFKAAAYDSTNFENSVKSYILSVVSKYKGRIVSWDVANEIFADNGSLRVDATVYKTFKDPIGFYGRCFKYARSADPAVKLFYNDYDQVLNGSKRNAVFNMIDRFKKEGYPIDGIGDQFHTTTWTNKATISSGLTNLASKGLLIHMSELDIRVNQDKSNSYVFTTIEMQKQAEMYTAVVAAFESLPQSQKYAITTWGISDKYTWLTGWWHPLEYPLLFDKTYAKKKAYEGFLSGLK
jgi:endo-1,4-beta-xylanase